MKYPNEDKGTVELGQITAAQIIAYVLEHRDAYPFEINPALEVNVFLDIPETISFNFHQWVHVSKRTFASENGVEPSQVSRWLAAGMPQRKDGRLNWYECEWWLECYRKQCEFRKRQGWPAQKEAEEE